MTEWGKLYTVLAETSFAFALRRASTISLGFDGEEAFSSAEEAAAAMANLTGAENLDSERDKFSQTMTFGDSDTDSDEEGEEY